MRDALFEVRRGKTLESIHRGRFAVVADSKLIAKKGDVDAPTFVRSAIKPLQAKAVLDSGAADAYGFSDQELAVISGSHYGEDAHVRAVQSILDKAGLRPDDLRCGTHAPFSDTQKKRLAREGSSPTVLHNNCSGKHSGMLAAAKKLGAPLASYLDPKHPLQRMNLDALAEYSATRRSSITIATDGCSAPTFALPIRSVARVFARFANDNDGALARITRAMTAHPEMIGHPCQELMSAVPGKIIGKIGAEGVYGAAVIRQGLGFALKIEDGSSRGTLPVIVALLLRHAKWSAAERSALQGLVKSEVTNHAGLIVGRMRAVID